MKKDGRGSYDVSTETTKGLSVVKWYDNKAVLLASTLVSAQPVDKCLRWSKAQKVYVEVDRPAVVKEYNTSMGGVDLSDMLMALYRIDIRPRRWYLRMLYYFIDLSTVNAWLLYRRHVKQLGLRKYKPLLDFRVEIADSLIKHGKAITKKRGRPSRDADEDAPRALRLRTVPRPQRGIRLDKVDHFPKYHEKRGRCRLCTNGYTQICSLVPQQGEQLLHVVPHRVRTVGREGRISLVKQVTLTLSVVVDYHDMCSYKWNL